MSDPINAKAATLGGTLLVLLVNINSADIIRTAVLAATGAVTSYLVSLLMKRAVRWWKSRKG